MASVHDARNDAIFGKQLTVYSQPPTMTTPPLSPALEELQAAARPLMEYLKKRHHPHVKAIVDSDSAEIVEGIACVRALATELRQEGQA